jgi:hypothetical protein
MACPEPRAVESLHGVRGWQSPTSGACITMTNDRWHKNADAYRKLRCAWGGGRVALQIGCCIVGSLGQHPNPDTMALGRPLKRDRGTVSILGTEALRLPVERRHVLEDSLERLHL